MENSNRFNKSLGFGFVLIVFLLVQNFLMNEDHSPKALTKSFIAAVITGIIGGFLFGWLTKNSNKPNEN